MHSSRVPSSSQTLLTSLSVSLSFKCKLLPANDLLTKFETDWLSTSSGSRHSLVSCVSSLRQIVIVYRTDDEGQAYRLFSECLFSSDSTNSNPESSSLLSPFPSVVSQASLALSPSRRHALITSFPLLVALASYGEVAFDMGGFLCQALGILFEAARLVSIQKLLTGLKMGPLVSLYYVRLHSLSSVESPTDSRLETVN